MPIVELTAVSIQTGCYNVGARSKNVNEKTMILYVNGFYSDNVKLIFSEEGRHFVSADSDIIHYTGMKYVPG